MILNDPKDLFITPDRLGLGVNIIIRIQSCQYIHWFEQGW